MTYTDRERLETASRKAREVREVWLRERKEQLEVKLAANAEVRKSWMDSDTSGARRSR